MKILFLQKRLLFPANTGGKIRTLNVLRHLARWHEVTYLCNIQEGEESCEKEMRELGVTLETIPWSETSRSSVRFYGQLAQNLLSPFPFNVAKDYDPQLKARAEALLAAEDYDIVICDFVQMARNAIGLPAKASLLFQHNVEAQIFERHAKTDKGWLRRQFMGYQWRKMKKFEGQAGRQFDTVVAVSDQDRETFRRQYDWNHVETIDTGVDTEYFSPNGQATLPNRVMFLGSLDWLPNQDGVDYFVQHVWPEVRRVCPDAEFQVVGRNPSPAMKQLSRVPGVEIVGTVPDVRPYLQQAAVVVVPLRIGGGTRIKIFESLAMSKAVVSTTLGAEGLKVEDGTHLVLADEPKQFASEVSRLLNDASRCQQLGDSARQTVVENFSAETVARQFEAICETVVASRRNKEEANSSQNTSSEKNSSGDIGKSSHDKSNYPVESA